MLIESKREAGVDPSQLPPPCTFTSGLGQSGTQSKKLAARGHVARTKKMFDQKASKPKKTEVSSHKTTLCLGCRRGTEGPVSGWGWSEPFS